MCLSRDIFVGKHGIHAKNIASIFFNFIQFFFTIDFLHYLFFHLNQEHDLPAFSQPLRQPDNVTSQQHARELEENKTYRPLQHETGHLARGFHTQRCMAQHDLPIQQPMEM